MGNKTRAKKTGDLQREVICIFCGQPHRRKSKEMRECRKRRGKPGGVAPEQQGAPTRPGTETTRYLNDPLRGDKNGHTIAKRYREGWAPRRIAKHMGLPLATVRAVIDKLEGRE